MIGSFRCYWVLPSFTGFRFVYFVVTGFYLVLLGFDSFISLLLGFTLVLLGFDLFISEEEEEENPVKPSKTQLNPVKPS